MSVFMVYFYVLSVVLVGLTQPLNLPLLIVLIMLSTKKKEKKILE